MPCRDVQQSAIAEARDQLFLDRADDIRLNIVTANLGLDRPTVGTDDDEWRALAKVVALQPKQVRNIFYRLLEICIGPQKTRTTYPVGASLVNDTVVTVSNPEAIIQVGTLVFDPGLATEEEVDFCFRDLVSGKVFLSTPLQTAHAAVVAADSYIGQFTGSGAATITLIDTTEFPITGFPYSVLLDEGTVTEEVVSVTGNNTITGVLTLSGVTLYDHKGAKSKGFIRRPIILDAIAGRDFLQFDADATRVFPATGFVRLNFGGGNEETVEYSSNDTVNAVLYLETPLANSHVAAESVEYVSPGTPARTAPVIERGVPWTVHETEPRKVKICVPQSVLTRRIVDASYIHDVTPTTFSTTTTATAAIGDTILNVVDTSGFRPQSGAIKIAGSIVMEYAAVVSATVLRLTYPLASPVGSGDTVDVLPENYAGTDLEEGNLRLSNGAINPEPQWPGPYIYDVTQDGVSLVKTALTAAVPPGSHVMVNQGLGFTCLDVEDVSLWPAGTYQIRVGHSSGFSEDVQLWSIVRRFGLSTTLTVGATAGSTQTLTVADASGFPASPTANPAGYSIVIERGSLSNYEVIKVLQNDKNTPGLLDLAGKVTKNHSIGATVELLWDVLVCDPLTQPHKGFQVTPTREGQRVDIIKNHLSVATTAGFPNTGRLWLNFGYNRPSVRARITSVVSSTVLAFADTSIFPTANFPYQVVVGEGAPNDVSGFFGYQELALVTGNNTSTNRLTLQSALIGTPTVGQYVSFRAGTPATFAYRDTDPTNIDLDAPTIFDSGYTVGEHVIASPGASLPSAFGTDYAFRMPPAPAACVQNLVDLVRAAGVEVFLLDNCKKLAALPVEVVDSLPAPSGDNTDEGVMTLSSIAPQDFAGGGTQYIQTWRPDISMFDGFAQLKIDFTAVAFADVDSTGGSIRLLLGGTALGLTGSAPGDAGTLLLSLSVPDNTPTAAFSASTTITNPGAGSIALRVTGNGGASEEGDFLFRVYSVTVTVRGVP